MTKMNLTDLCDFTRGLSDAESDAALRSELLSAKPSARRFVDMLSRVATVGRLDEELEIPEHALRVAKAVGSLRRPARDAAEPCSGLMRYLPFSIDFDSLREPALVGTRNLHADDRQLRVSTEGYSVELRVERGTEADSTVVVGQLLEGDATAAKPAAEIPVLAIHSGRIVSRTCTGSFGEFHAERLPNDASNLCFLVEGQKCLEFPLGTVH